MKGGTTAVKSILYEGYLGPRMNREMAMERIRQVIREELTDLQREVLIAYYFQDQNIPQIAKERGVNRSTVSRTLHRAEDKLRRYLKY